MMKITKKDYFRMLADVVANAGVENEQELMMFIDKEIGLLEKKRTVNTAKKQEIDTFVETVYEALAEVGRPVTVSELQKEVPAMAEFSNQKVSAAMKKLKDADRVVKVTEKKKSYFSVA